MLLPDGEVLPQPQPERLSGYAWLATPGKVLHADERHLEFTSDPRDGWIARRLGFTVREWKLMEADECMVPDPDGFWERAMALVDKVESGG